MYKFDLNTPAHIHFIGIGGISMSGLALLLLSKGFKISGSDEASNEITENLASHGAIISKGHFKKNITDDLDAVIYTGAISENNPEIVAAKENQIPLITRGVLMGMIMKHYRHAVGISGTDGKTTTTSLLSMMLENACFNPTISVGGIIPALNTNFKIGSEDYFVVESCEYTNSFLDFSPTDIIILNIREDHLDFFKDIDDIRNSFKKFSCLVPGTGLAVINSEIPDYTELFKDAKCHIKTYGLIENESSRVSDFNAAAANITYDECGRGSYDLYFNGKFMGRITLNLIGRHNVSNSLAAILMALNYDVPFSVIKETCAAFSGAKRRFEPKGTFNTVPVIDDYAHNPSEIKATLTGARAYNKRIVTVFQPHTYSRTKAFLHEFADALSLSDVVVLADIYAAREIDDGTVSSVSIYDLLKQKGKEVYYFSTFKKIENFLSAFLINNDMLITMGAGNVVNVGEELLSGKFSTLSTSGDNF